MPLSGLAVLEFLAQVACLPTNIGRSVIRRPIIRRQPCLSARTHTPTSALNSESMYAQMCSAATDTLVAPTTQVYFGWTLDASAVFMLGMCASGKHPP